MNELVNMNRLLEVMSVFSALLFAMVLFSVRRQHIRVEYSVAWLAASVVLFVVSQSKTLIYGIAGFLGISYAPVGMLLLIFCLFLVVLYRYSIRISDLKDSSIALAQRVAILEYQLRSMHEERQNSSE